MSIQINTNVSALNAQRNLASTNHRLGNLFEKLSSGMRINRAADDAAGLAISEKMRAQFRGMQQGQRNAQDGISMLQTTEGGLSEVTSILQRIRELCVQVGNSTLAVADRQAMGEEILALGSEIDNIGNRTRFNGQQLLTGALSVSLDAANSTADTVTYTNGGATTSVSSIDVSTADPGETYTLSAAGAVLTLTHDDGSGFVRNETFTVQAMGASGAQAVTFEQLGVTLNLFHDANAANHTGANIASAFNGTTIVTGAGGPARFRVGAEATDNISVPFSDMRLAALGDANKMGTLIVDNDVVSTTAKSDTLLQSVDAAMTQVSLFRAKLGAAQNQMESAVNSLAVSVENLSASESRIRDADFAQVSSQLVAQQIMQQAGVAVLAQANTAPQAVLALLRGQ